MNEHTFKVRVIKVMIYWAVDFLLLYKKRELVFLRYF